MPTARDSTGPRSVSASPPWELLVLYRSPDDLPRERADAARNRTAVLEAAAALFRRYGIDRITMDAVAAEAGVGKGTLFRRFGDKAGLAEAVLDERERELQQAILFGPAPLGPGDPDEKPEPADRLYAFVDAYLDYALAHLDLVRVSETQSRYDIGAYRFWHRHVSILLAALGREDVEADAHTLLAPLAATHLQGVTDRIGLDRLRHTMRALATAFSSPG